MRRASAASAAALAHPAGAVVMAGVVVMPLTAPDRLRLYRRCFHELEDQMALLQQHVVDGRDGEARCLQAELRCLEELIMVFTELNPAPSKAQLLTTEVWMADAAVVGLDLSVVTDILMLSATSPWTVYIADRNQWLLSYVSPSGRRTTGWTSLELLGTPAWGACHSDDMHVVQRMLHLRDSEGSGGSVIYRRLRKDLSYVTVQATGRSVGSRLANLFVSRDRWFAWVEQDILNFSPVISQPERDPLLKASSKAAPRVVLERDASPVVIRPRRQSAPWVAPPEAPNLHLDHAVVGSKPGSPPVVVAAEAFAPQLAHKHESLTIDFDQANIAELSQMHSQSPKVVTVATTNLSTETDQDGAAPSVHANSMYNETATKANNFKSKGFAQDPLKNPSTSASKQRPDAAPLLVKELLQGKKVLLAEDDAVNRKVGQRLLRSMNCDVTVVCNGQEALDVLRQGPPAAAAAAEQEEQQQLASGETELPPQFDLVLMDLQMPVMDGAHAMPVMDGTHGISHVPLFKTVQMFRDWEELHEPPRKRMTIFALTANVSDRDMVKCAQSGFDEFVSKPLTIEKLLERLRKLHNDPVLNNQCLDP